MNTLIKVDRYNVYTYMYNVYIFYYLSLQNDHVLHRVGYEIMDLQYASSLEFSEFPYGIKMLNSNMNLYNIFYVYVEYRDALK